MALRLELLIAIAMLRSLYGPSLGAFRGPCYSWELGWPFSGSFTWPLLRLGARLALRWDLLMALDMLGSLDGALLITFNDNCYAWELGWPFVGSFS